ncbi:DUF397 domain-containing protein [Streptomyces sp. NPDC047042]|uniref:DUF397 domain-containing protein n=1 Tax=Streptomyces sp. NPDC047042 TaxID=3154807 RepID=UPI0034083CCD
MIRETSAKDAAELAWFKSSHSSGPDGDSCVEIATTPKTIHVRDSKHIENGPRLGFTPSAWAGFIPHASK